MTKFEIQIGNIADIKADAIVNAANQKLVAGSGVCGAIFAKAGPGLALEIAKEHEYGCETGDAVTTGAYDLHAKHIIHAVAPIWGKSAHEVEKLRSAYRAIFREARYWGVKSVAIPCLGTGVYGWDFEEATGVAKQGILEGLRDYPTIEKVIFNCFTNQDVEVYESMFATELEYGLDLAPHCPRCAKPAVAIFYGMPMAADFNDPTFYAGGCIIMPGQPNWACRGCQLEFA